MPTGDSQPRILPQPQEGQDHTRDVDPAPGASGHTSEHDGNFNDFQGPSDSTEVIRGAETGIRRNHDASTTDRPGHIAEFTLGGTVPRVEPGQRISKRAEDLYLRLEGNIYGPVSMDELESLLSSGLLTGYETISGDLNKWTPLAYHPRMIASRDSDLDATHSILSQYSDLPAPVRAEDSVPTGLTALLDDDDDDNAPPAAIVNRPSRIGSTPAIPAVSNPEPEPPQSATEPDHDPDPIDPQAAETLEQPVAMRPEPQPVQEDSPAAETSPTPPLESPASPHAPPGDVDLFAPDPLLEMMDRAAHDEEGEEDTAMDPDLMSDTSVANDPRARHILQRAAAIALFITGAALIGGMVYLNCQ